MSVPGDRSGLEQYRPREAATVLALRLDLELQCFQYEKWGGKQQARRGDWVVDKDGDVYTVTDSNFSRTYRLVRPGLYRKDAPVWACLAPSDGVVPSEEGSTAYQEGDYVVFHLPEDDLGWAMRAEEFLRTYEAVSG